MPPLTRWYIKLALLYLVAALLGGALAAAQRPLGLPAVWAASGPTYIHLLVVGWITGMIFGVAYWMFPKHSPERPRGSNALAIATFALLHGGLLLRAVAEPMHQLQPSSGWGAVLVASAVAQWLAGLGFAVAMWPRVRER
ncbi:MAG TPA: hypothetical protein VNI61_00580 [Gemmatimonadales bacterium]|nr:hypothetical protein [Gemmatimonadales bacterium]